MNVLDNKAEPKRGFARKLFFLAILLVLGVVLLLIGELAVRIFVPAQDDPFVSLRGRATVFSEVVEDGVKKFKITHPSAYQDANTTVPVEKSDDMLRVFCLGGSASAGWPHPKQETYPAYLEQALQAAYPDRKVQVVNAGAHGFASYRVRSIFDEVLRLAPDLIVIYSGNNEFVEKRSYLVDSAFVRFARSIERHSRLAQIVVGSLRDRLYPENRLDGAGGVDQDFHTWTHTEQLALELRRDKDQFAEVLSHYEHSIEHMVEDALASGVPVMVLTVPVNLRDWRPNVSVESLEGELWSTWRGHYLAARSALVQEDTTEAVRRFELALELDPEHARSWFELGLAHEAAGRRAEARSAYVAAKDADANPFRAHSKLNEIVRLVANRHPGAVLLDADVAFQRGTSLPAPGFDLFLDYVHPSRAGNLLLARSVFDVIVERRLLGPATGARSFGLVNGGRRADDSVYEDAEDPNVQVTLLGLFSIMHQYESFIPKLDDFLALCARRGLPLPEPHRDFLANCRKQFTEFLQAERDEALGRKVDPEFREKHRRFYREEFGKIQSLRGVTGDGK